MTGRLSHGLSGVDASVVTAAGALLPEGEYLPVLTEIRPRLVMPGGAGDYFAAEQVRIWGLNDFWGLPEYPRTAYYRGADALAGPAARLFEFIVPMVPPSWNDERQVAATRNGCPAAMSRPAWPWPSLTSAAPRSPALAPMNPTWRTGG